jgi:hypothetical protein
MNKELIIIGIIVTVIAIAGIAVFMYSKDKKKENLVEAEKFDISVDPLREGAYGYLNAITCPDRAPCVNNTQYGGLNAEYDQKVTVKDFIDCYEKETDFKNPIAAKITAKKYCQMLYTNHIEYFTGCKGYLSFGECEIGTEKEIDQMYPETMSEKLWNN